MPNAIRFLSSIAAAAALAVPGLLAAQPTSQSMSIGGAQLAAPRPDIVRADAPPAGSHLPDPSLANTYNFTTPDGINFNGVGNFIIPDPDLAGYIFSCTASRIGLRSLLIAAHCVTNDNTGALLSTSGSAFARFLGPGSVEGSPNWYYTPDASQIVVNPLWDGFNNPATYLGTDVAVIDFASDLPDWIPTYELYTGIPLGALATNVGFGTYGGGTGATGFDYGRRWGTNEVDYIAGDHAYDDYLDIYTDFDDPAGKFDTLCVLGIVCDTGLLTEAATSEGDSGGPLFVDGKIAGVTSFSTYVCAPASPPGTCVPFVADPARPFDSFGSLHAFAPVFANADFIETSITPEPASIMFTATGLIGLAGFARRRRKA
ncbi:MAG: trypsin-like serine protease [Gemmatimonadaceae bacterium]